MGVNRQYYCLAAGLRELASPETGAVDVVALRAEIIEDLSRRDIRAVELLYGSYDIENLISARRGSERFSPLGNIAREELDNPKMYPARMARVVNGFREESDDEDFEREEAFERMLWGAWYEECGHSKCVFLKRWADADRVIRSIVAGLKVSDVVSDEGLTEQVRSILGEPNLAEREQRLDILRWELADEFSERHFFDIDFLLGYLVRANIIEHRSHLNPDMGRAFLMRLVEKLKHNEE